MISENNLTVSENTISKKRGRPSIITPEEKALFERVYSHLTTNRSIQNKWFLAKAVNAIRDHADFKWLLDRETHFIRETILAELGRIENDADLLSLAREICELKPTSREGVRVVRRWRLQAGNKKSQPPFGQTVNNLTKPTHSGSDSAG